MCLSLLHAHAACSCLNLLTAGYIFFGSMVEIGRRVRECAATLCNRGPMDDLLREAGLDYSTDLLAKADKAAAVARRFLLLDLRNVTGIDATTASAFAMLRRALDARQVTLVLTGVTAHPAVGRMLVANNVIPSHGAWEHSLGCPAFASMDAAIFWCEEHFTQARGNFIVVCAMADILN
jgi:STAS domain